MRKLPARKLLGALIAGALFLPNKGFTLGLGEIEVNSALNQKLNADIAILSATPEDTETIIVKLASREEFLRAGLDRPYELNDLRFKSVVIDDTPHIIVTSSGPIREPFLNFLIEVDWPNGHLLREYTVLLDPPVFMSQSTGASSAQVNQGTSDSDFRPASGGSANVVPVYTPGAAASSMSSRPSGQVATQPNATQAPANPAFIPAPMVPQQTSINQPPGSYRIKTGDTAWSLADAMRPDQSISVEQMMIAMLRANPESFIDENINGLKRGYILRLPDYDQITSINQADARAMVREQAALWRQYQQSQAGGQPVSAMPSGEMQDTAGADESEGAAATDAYLEIVSAGSGSSTMSGKDPTKMTAQELRAELALARERVETERVEKEALQQRVSTLEQHVNKMKGMLSIEDEELSGVQSLSSLTQDELTALQTDQDVLPEEPAAEQDMAAEPLDAESAGPGTIEETAAEMSGETAESTDDATSSDAVFTDETAAPEDLSASMAEAPEQGEIPAEDTVTTEPQIAERPATDPLSQLLNDPMLLAAAGGGLLLIAALVGLIIKRRKAAAETGEPAMERGLDDLESLADDIAGTSAEDQEVMAESIAAKQSAGSESSKTKFDSDATMVLDSAEDTVITEANPSAADQDDEARDDVIAEADVYLAYGIYQQAEELLSQAIADNPERDDYRVKLAETYYASKNAEAFVEVASEIKKRTGNDDAPAWKKVMVMGQDLCADNPMFQGSMVGGLDVGSLAPAAPEMDFDLGLDEVADTETAPDLDLDTGDESLELPDFDHGMDEVTDEDVSSVEEIDELEFDLSDTGAVEDSSAAEDEFSLDIDASELDIDIQGEATDSDEESLELSDVDLGLDLDKEAENEGDEITDLGDADLDFGLDDDTLAAEAEEVEQEVSLDLSEEAESLGVDSLDMDLGDAVDITEVSEEAEVAAVPSDTFGELEDEEDFDLSSLDDVDEISTKLDLARAYLDMGDHEGSRGILEEVLAEGNDEQKEEANELLSKLS